MKTKDRVLPRFLFAAFVVTTQSSCRGGPRVPADCVCATGVPTTTAATGGSPPQAIARGVSRDNESPPEATPSRRLNRLHGVGYLRLGSIWLGTGTYRTIPVCWDDVASSTEADRALVQQAVVDTWEANSRVRFTGWHGCPTTRAAGIHIAVADVGPHTKGLGNELDTKPAGMVLNFAFRAWSTSCADSDEHRRSCIQKIAVHEFGHALGFAHEQNRPLSQTPPEFANCAEQERQGSNGDFTFGKWDLHSVMNYCNPDWNGDGHLSELDIETVGAFYGYPLSGHDE